MSLIIIFRMTLVPLKFSCLNFTYDTPLKRYTGQRIVFEETDLNIINKAKNVNSASNHSSWKAISRKNCVMSFRMTLFMHLCDKLDKVKKFRSCHFHIPTLFDSLPQVPICGTAPTPVGNNLIFSSLRVL